MGCCLGTNSQYSAKYEYSMNLGINIQRYSSTRDKNFQNPGHKFNERQICDHWKI